MNRTVKRTIFTKGIRSKTQRFVKGSDIGPELIQPMPDLEISQTLQKILFDRRKCKPTKKLDRLDAYQFEELFSELRPRFCDLDWTKIIQKKKTTTLRSLLRINKMGPRAQKCDSVGRTQVQTSEKEAEKTPRFLCATREQCKQEKPFPSDEIKFNNIEVNSEGNCLMESFPLYPHCCNGDIYGVESFSIPCTPRKSSKSSFILRSYFSFQSRDFPL